jgi:hypothetical protein
MPSTISTPVTARLHHEDVAALNRIVDHTPRTTVSSLIAAYVRDGLRRHESPQQSPDRTELS